MAKHLTVAMVGLQAAAALGIAPKDVVHGVNYQDINVRNFEIDRLTYKILDMALHSAHNFCAIPQRMYTFSDLMSGEWQDDDRNMDFSVT